jgi:hypothetical protein
MELPKSPLARIVRWRGIPILLGAAGGFAYYYFIGCASGSCPITSNPWVSTAYGGLIGFVASGGLRPGRQTKKNEA